MTRSTWQRRFIRAAHPAQFGRRRDRPTRLPTPGDDVEPSVSSSRTTRWGSNSKSERGDLRRIALRARPPTCLFFDLAARSSTASWRHRVDRILVGSRRVSPFLLDVWAVLPDIAPPTCRPRMLPLTSAPASLNPSVLRRGGGTARSSVMRDDLVSDRLECPSWLTYVTEPFRCGVPFSYSGCAPGRAARKRSSAYSASRIGLDSADRKLFGFFSPSLAQLNVGSLGPAGSDQLVVLVSMRFALLGAPSRRRVRRDAV